MKLMVAVLITIIFLLTPDHIATPMPKKEIQKVLAKIEVRTRAYYKPVKEQEDYLEEIKLNGEGITATGKKVKIGFIAADWKKFPVGTIIKIPNHGIVTVEDKGGAIKGNKIDIFMGEGKEGRNRANVWGKQDMIVEVLKWGGC